MSSNTMSLIVEIKSAQARQTKAMNTQQHSNEINPLTLRVTVQPSESRYFSEDIRSSMPVIQPQIILKDEDCEKNMKVESYLRILNQKIMKAKAQLSIKIPLMNDELNSSKTSKTTRSELAQPCSQPSLISSNGKVLSKGLQKPNRKLKYFTSTIMNGIKQGNSLIQEYINSLIKNLKVDLTVECPSLIDVLVRKVELQRDERYEGCKTLLIQLEDIFMMEVPPTNEAGLLQVEIEGKKKYFKLRPHAISFLKRVSKKFEIFVYSRMERETVGKIVEEMDPEGNYIGSYFGAQLCHWLPGGEMGKDLRMIGRNLRDVVILDTGCSNIIIQSDNMIPVVPFLFQNDQDQELLHLERFLLNEVTKVSDVRELCKQRFGLHRYWRFNNPLDLIRVLYN